MTDRSAEFLAIAASAREIADRMTELNGAALDVLDQAANDVGRAWSQSSLGYQANVYYKDFQPPPAGALFSREWGFFGTFHGTTGDWEPHTAQQVVDYIEELAGHPDLSKSRDEADQARSALHELIERARSAAAKIPLPHDDYLKAALDKLQRLFIPELGALAQAQMNVVRGQFAIRDMRAAEGGWEPAGHQIAKANVAHIQSPYKLAADLAQVCQNLGNHLEDGITTGAAVIQLGTKVILGHGGASAEYLKLGVWLTDRGLVWDVFDRKPTAGLSTKERLSEMLDDASIAFVLMTPEDVTADGEMRARDNVIHEVGLFQGRLGWMKAIVLLEEGCSEFSNIEGVGQIRYPKGNIKAAFDEIRGVLEREGIL